MKDECLICGSPLKYLENDELMECAVCHKKENSKTACVKGHYVCNECHTQGMDSIVGVCLAETSKNPVEIIQKMMALPFCHMHGPEHHVMVGSALLTAYKNAGGDIDLPKALSEMQARGKKVPGGACGFWGACGAGVSAGMFVSIVTGSTPLANEAWGLSNKMTSAALSAIGEVGGPRCCKRDSYLAIMKAVEFAREHLGVEMELGEIKCTHFAQNNQCIGKRCPFWGKRENMLTYTYISKGKFGLVEKPKPTIQHERDAIVKVTLASICSSDLHIKHGSVPRAVEGITVGHEMVGIVEEVGSAVTHVKPGDRVTVNVETFCGECFFCKKGFVNNCTDKNGGWALGCRIDGGQAEYVRVPFADQGLNKIPDTVTDRQALLVGDVLATGYWAAKISEITEDDTVLIIGAGPTGICTLLCVMLKHPKRIIVCEKDENRIKFVNEHYPNVLTVTPEECLDFVRKNSDHGGADVVLEVAGAENTFELAWQCARPNAIVTVVALYDKAQTLPLPDMYGKNLTFKIGGVDGCDCEETLKLIAEGELDTEPLITHTYPLSKIDEAYELFENKRDGVIKVAVEC